MSVDLIGLVRGLSFFSLDLSSHDSSACGSLSAFGEMLYSPDQGIQLERFGSKLN